MHHAAVRDKGPCSSHLKRPPALGLSPQKRRPRNCQLTIDEAAAAPRITNIPRATILHATVRLLTIFARRDQEAVPMPGPHRQFNRRNKRDISRARQLHNERTSEPAKAQVRHTGPVDFSPRPLRAAEAHRAQNCQLRFIERLGRKTSTPTEPSTRFAQEANQIGRGSSGCGVTPTEVARRPVRPTAARPRNCQLTINRKAAGQAHGTRDDSIGAVRASRAGQPRPIRSLP